MNEAAFIKANLQRWEQFEKWLETSPSKDPDELASQGLWLYIPE